MTAGNGSLDRRGGTDGPDRPGHGFSEVRLPSTRITHVDDLQNEDGQTASQRLENRGSARHLREPGEWKVPG